MLALMLFPIVRRVRNLASEEQKERLDKAVYHSTVLSAELLQEQARKSIADSKRKVGGDAKRLSPSRPGSASYREPVPAGL